MSWSTFSAIPRYTQVIIKPIQTFNKPYQYGMKNYGPIFHHFVMQQVRTPVFLIPFVDF